MCYIYIYAYIYKHMHTYMLTYIYVFERSSTIKIAVERVNQEKGLVELAAYITLAGNQQ